VSAELLLQTGIMPPVRRHTDASETSDCNVVVLLCNVSPLKAAVVSAALGTV